MIEQYFLKYLFKFKFNIGETSSFQIFIKISAEISGLARKITFQSRSFQPWSETEEDH